MMLTLVRGDINYLLSFFSLLVGVLKMVTFKYAKVLFHLILAGFESSDVEYNHCQCSIIFFSIYKI